MTSAWSELGQNICFEETQVNFEKLVCNNYELISFQTMRRQRFSIC